MPQGAGFFFCRIPNVSLHYPIILIKQSICGLGMETKKNNIEFIPKFEKSFLLPRYWGAWLGVFALAGCIAAALLRRWLTEGARWTQDATPAA